MAEGFKPVDIYVEGEPCSPSTILAGIFATKKAGRHCPAFKGGEELLGLAVNPNRATGVSIAAILSGNLTAF